MKQDAFEQANTAEWASFEELCAGARGDLPRSYRRICQHLALARHRCYSAGLIQRLNALVLRGHQELYGHAPGPVQGWTTWAGAFPRRVRALRGPVLLAALLFALPFGGLTQAVRRSPERAFLVEDPQALARMEAMYEGGNGRFGREDQADTDVMMFGFYIWNNVRLGFQAFAGGLLLGLGALLFLVLNGLHAGAVAGWLTQAGLGGNFWSFVVTHTAFEIPSLVLSGAAGLRVGWSLLAPGRHSRLQALRRAVKEVLPLVYGAAAMDVLAAGLEAFWSSSARVPQGAKFGAGAMLWTAVAGYFLLAGRRRAR